ncbi:1-deoxy-D-xylulose-5-phosphate synthase [Anaerotardibacter muris]|uniref:1-deoxy-D-xylulose-5-phosphate synthase n=1 Tax=Anaerotardibacter muris TaxID=2941505 RepID=UPI00203CEBAA|nr:1-deoxy-D-xylulose-5-phosphate synthase [Anaerotardibacter muris]
MANRILDSIESPDALKLLTDDELAILAEEIREEILRTTSETGGHVASSLGAVEIILAVHSLIDSPKDRFLFDVGHQSYAHMLLTGRRDEFKTLRQYKGLSGFPKPSSNPHDVHPSGHASDSLSVACGIARARDLSGSDQKVVALIGDASLAGGMAFEALNDIGQAQTPMVIILNDNEMAISRNVGAMARHLGAIRVSSNYRKSRDGIQERLESFGNAGKALVKMGKTAKESVKQLILPDSMLFESLGIICTPPIDGHNIPALKHAIEDAFAANAPVLVHVITKKGKGYEPAEQNPSKFHGVGSYDLATGQSKKKSSGALTYTQAFTKALQHEAEVDDSVVVVTAAMTDGTGLAQFADTHPERFFDVGIAEEHAVAMASGLAMGGKKPVVALYSTFMQRALDQLIINTALPQANVVFAIDRAGLVGDDGPTHHGVFDLVYARMVPHVRILAPSNEPELASALHTALALDGPILVRYPRGEAPGMDMPAEPELFEEGVSKEVRAGSDVAILAFGRMVNYALDAAELLNEQGISARVVDMRWVKPIDKDAIRMAADTKLVVTIEDGVIIGGACEAVHEVLGEEGLKVDTLSLGLPDEFIEQGKVDLLFADLGLDAQGIARQIQEKLS